jgi:hypothetical protein
MIQEGKRPLRRKAGAISESSAGRGCLSLALSLALCLFILWSPALPPTGAFQAEAGGWQGCPSRPQDRRLAGLAHWYDDIGNLMANGEAFTAEGMTVAIRQDLLADWPLGSKARLKSACGFVLVTITDVMPFCEAQPEVVVDVSPAICAALFCGGCGYNGKGVAYGEEYVMLEKLEGDGNGTVRLLVRWLIE